MAGSDLQITFGADSSALLSGVGVVRNALDGLNASLASLKAAISGVSGSLARQSDAMGNAATATRTVQAGVAKAQEEDDKRLTASRLQAIDIQTRAAIRGAQEQLAVQKDASAEQIEAIKLQAALGQISQVCALDQIQALQAKETQSAIAAVRQQIAALEAGYEAKVALHQLSVEREIALDTQLVAAKAQLWGRINALAAAGLRQQDADELASVQRIKQAWSGVVDPLVASFSGGLLKMAEGTQNFAQTMRGIGEQIAQDFLRNVVDKNVENWLWGESRKLVVTVAGSTDRMLAEATGQSLTAVLENKAIVQHQLAEFAKTGSTTAGVAARSTVQAVGAAQTMAISGATSLKEITNSAASAAGDAYKAMSGIPIVGPVLGAAAAAAVFGAVIAFKGLIASAAGGYDIPAGVNPLTQLHAEEMVLPATIARPLRNMIMATDVGSEDRRGSAARGQETHVHHHSWQIHGAIDGPSLRRVLQANAADHAAAMESLVRGRNGKGFGS